MESSNPQGTSLTVGQAADTFLGMMAGNEILKEQPQSQQEYQEVEAGESEHEEAIEEAQEEEQRFVVKAAGEEREVTLQELIEGYQKGTDYHKKTNALAEQRKAVDAEKAAVEQAKQARDAYAQRLQVMDQFLSQQMKGEDIESLKETDPIAYAVKVAEMTRQEKQLQQLRAEQQRIAREQQAEQEVHMERRIAEEAQKVANAIPDYADPKKGEKVRSDLRAFAKSIGYSDAELASATDSRAVVTLWMAAQYQKLQQSKPGVTKKVTEAPKLLKPGTATGKTIQSEAAKQDFARLKKTGSRQDAARVFERFL
jgi:hypothetical protein